MIQFIINIFRAKSLARENAMLKNRLLICESDINSLITENHHLKMRILNRNNINGFSNFN